MILASTSPLRRTPPRRTPPRPPIRRLRASDLTRDQRRDIQLLRSLGWKYKDIERFTKATPSQVYTAYTIRATPTKRPGRPPLLTQAQIEELIEFVYASKENRRMSYNQLTKTLNFRIKRYTI